MKLPNVISLTVLGLVFWAVETYAPDVDIARIIEVATIIVTMIAKAYQEYQAAHPEQPGTPADPAMWANRSSAPQQSWKRRVLTQ